MTFGVIWLVVALVAAITAMIAPLPNCPSPFAGQSHVDFSADRSAVTVWTFTPRRKSLLKDLKGRAWESRMERWALDGIYPQEQ
jgi:hypothetical protein